jgi:DNA repair exonuclease SbcCD ATPase subunit
MKILRLSLHDFVNHARTEIDLSSRPVHVFLGPNGAGKTAIRQAIEWALTGVARGTDARGAGAERLIRAEASRMEVSLQLEIDGQEQIRLVRHRSHKGSAHLHVDGWSGPTPTQQALLEQRLGADARLIRSVLDVGRFLDLPPKDQARMLLDVAGLRITRERLLEECSRCDLSSSAHAAVRRLLEEQGPEPWGPEIVRDIYQRAYERRRELRRDEKRLEAQLQGLTGAQPQGLYGRSLEQLQAEEQQLLVRLEAANRTVGELQEKARRRQEAIEALRRHGERSGQAQTADEPEVLQARLREVRRQRAERQRQIGALIQRIMELRAELQTLDVEQGRLSSPPETCPTCGRPWPEEDLAARKAEIAKARRSITRRRTRASKKVSQLERELQEAKAAEKTLDEEARSLEARLEALRAGRLVDRIQETLRETEGVEDALGAAEAGVRDLSARLDGLREQIVRARDLQAKAEAAKGLRASLEAVRAKLQVLEELLAAFGPDGPIAASLAGGRLQEAVHRVNGRLEVLTGGRIQLSMDPSSTAVTVWLQQGPALRSQLTPSDLSRSERWRLGLVLAEALAHLSGLRVLAIDDAEVLDAQNRAALFSLLPRWAEDFDTVLIFATGEPKGRSSEHVAIWHVQDGQVSLVGEQVAVGS